MSLAGQAERPTATAGREIAFLTAGSSCQSNWGAVRKPPLSKLCPGRSNKTPRVLRHGHSSCLGPPIPSKATPKSMGRDSLGGLGGELLTTSGSPFADLSFLSAQAASTENIPRSADSTLETQFLSSIREQKLGTPDPTVLCFILFIHSGSWSVLHSQQISSICLAEFNLS